MQEIIRNLLIHVLFYEYCAFFCELCDWMQFEVDCAKSHDRVISEDLISTLSAHSAVKGLMGT